MKREKMKKIYKILRPPLSLPCDFTPTSRLAGDPIIGEGDHSQNGRGVVIKPHVHLNRNDTYTFTLASPSSEGEVARESVTERV